MNYYNNIMKKGDKVINVSDVAMDITIGGIYTLTHDEASNGDICFVDDIGDHRTRLGRSYKLLSYEYMEEAIEKTQEKLDLLKKELEELKTPKELPPKLGDRYVHVSGNIYTVASVWVGGNYYVLFSDRGIVWTNPVTNIEDIFGRSKNFTKL